MVKTPATKPVPEQAPAPVTQQSQLPAEEADLNERIEGFNKEILPLLARFELGLAALPKILPDGRTVADPILVSVRQRPTPAPTEAPTAPALAKVE